jgi:hypothetical protein
MIANPGCLVRYLRHKAATAVLPRHHLHGIGDRSLQGFRLFSTLRWWNTTLSSINRPSGGIDSAHASVSNKPRATNAAKHGWIQNATKWFDRHEVRSREPRHPADVDSPVQPVAVWAAHQGSTDEAVDRPVGFHEALLPEIDTRPKSGHPEYLALFRSRVGRVPTGVPEMSLPAVSEDVKAASLT